MRRWVSKGPKWDVWIHLIIRVVAGRGDNTQRSDQG